MELIEYRLRPVTRYIVTRFEEERHSDGKVSAAASTVHGEFDSAATAFEVAYALCRAEHDRLGWPVGDERIKYPAIPAGVSREPHGAGFHAGAYDNAPKSELAAA